MNTAVSHLPMLLHSMAPRLHAGTCIAASVPHGTDVSAWQPVVRVHETEGLSVALRVLQHSG